MFSPIFPCDFMVSLHMHQEVIVSVTVLEVSGIQHLSVQYCGRERGIVKCCNVPSL